MNKEDAEGLKALDVFNVVPDKLVEEMTDEEKEMTLEEALMPDLSTEEWVVGEHKFKIKSMPIFFERKFYNVLKPYVDQLHKVMNSDGAMNVAELSAIPNMLYEKGPELVQIIAEANDVQIPMEDIERSLNSNDVKDIVLAQIRKQDGINRIAQYFFDKLLKPALSAGDQLFETLGRALTKVGSNIPAIVENLSESTPTDSLKSTVENTPIPLET